MILYKYLQPERLDVLEHKRIRFTQPGDFNDPFEFRPQIQGAASDELVRAHIEEHFEELVEDELDKYGTLVQLVPRPALKEALLALKTRLPDLFRLLEPQMLQAASSSIDSVLNQNVGVLCLSEVRDSILMWGHYTDSHQGFVVGFDSEHSFFSKRRSEVDEFGFLRQVVYRTRRPQVILSDTSSPDWFQTKSEQWAYEKEWRIVRVLAEAQHRLSRSPFPICLFEFPPDAIREIIVGMRSSLLLVGQIRSLAAEFPGAALLKAREDPRDYSLLIEEIGHEDTATASRGAAH